MCPDLPFEITTSQDERAVVIAVTGELDVLAAQSLREALGRVPADAGDLELDLRGVTFVDSSGLAVLLRAGEFLGDGIVPAIAPSPAVLGLLELTGTAGRVRLAEESR